MHTSAERRTDVTIRPAVARDLPAIMDLITELDRLQEDWRVFPSRPSLREETLGRYQRAIRDQAGSDVLMVAEASGTVVGSGFGHVLVPSIVSDEPALRFWEGLGFSHRMVQLVAPVDRVARRSSP